MAYAFFVAFQRFKNFINQIMPKITPAITSNTIMLLNENPPKPSAGGFTITTGGDGRSIEKPAKPIAQQPTDNRCLCLLILLQIGTAEDYPVYQAVVGVYILIVGAFFVDYCCKFAELRFVAVFQQRELKGMQPLRIISGIF